MPGPWPSLGDLTNQWQQQRMPSPDSMVRTPAGWAGLGLNPYEGLYDPTMSSYVDDPLLSYTQSRQAPLGGGERPNTGDALYEALMGVPMHLDPSLRGNVEERGPVQGGSPEDFAMLQSWLGMQSTGRADPEAPLAPGFGASMPGRLADELGQQDLMMNDVVRALSDGNP